MKKIININLSGRVIPIEDSAYESLQRYIESLRRYFANEDGRDEIINDIESRIAELMNDKIKKGITAVTETDVDEIISSMGRIEDFEKVDAADNAGTDQATSATYTRADGRRFKGRLYRDASDKLLGGVCSGIANYMNVDPAVIRLLFAIITFGGFGFGILIYIVLWIVLPTRPLATYVGKRLFRNPDDRIIAGVAGGIGAYFDKPAWAIRLIFAAPLIINILLSGINGIFSAYHGPFFPDFFFGSFTSTFILAYIILWIVLPEAKSQYEKMEMRGETIDVNRIRQNVQEEINQFRSEAKDRAKAFSEEVKTSAQNFSERARDFASTRGRTFASEMSETARPVARGLGHAIGVLFKAFFLFVAGSIAFALFVVLIVVLFGSGTAIWPLKQNILNFMLDGFWQKLFFWGAVLLFLAIPLIAFITWLVRRIMKVKTQRHYLGWIFGGLWLIGVFCVLALAGSIVRDVRYYEKVPQPVAITQPPSGKMIVRVNEPEVRYGGEMWWIADEGSNGWDITDDSMKLANIKVRIIKSDDSNYGVTIYKYSAGRTRHLAEAKAEKINYNAYYTDSTLILGSGLGINRDSKFRGQKVIVEIKVPVGKRIRLDESIKGKLHPAHVRIGERNTWNDYGRNSDWDNDDYFDWNSDTDYVMTADGQLEEVDTYKNNPNGVYEYRSNTDSVQREIDKKEKQLEKDRENLQRMQDEKAAKQTTKIELKKNNEELLAQVHPFLPIVI